MMRMRLRKRKKELIYNVKSIYIGDLVAVESVEAPGHLG